MRTEVIATHYIEAIKKFPFRNFENFAPYLKMFNVATNIFRCDYVKIVFVVFQSHGASGEKKSDGPRTIHYIFG